MNKLKYIALSLLCGAGLTGCNDMLGDNVNPDKAHTNEVSQGMPVLVFYANQTVYDHAEYNVYLSQCLTTMGKSQNGSLAYQSGWQFLTMNRHPQWRRHFYDIGRNANLLIEEARKTGYPQAELIARTIKLMSLQMTTDIFGDMPYTEAYGTNTPKYDTQASLYQVMFDEIAELKQMYKDDAYVNNPDALPITKTMDRIYSGDIKAWEGLLYALEARILLRNIPNIDRSAATCQKIIDAAQQAINIWRSGDLRYGAWFGNEPRYNFDGGVGEQNAPWSENCPVINSWESRGNTLKSSVPSKFFVQDLLGVADPGDERYQGTFTSNFGYGNDPRLMLLFVPNNGPTSASISGEKYMIRYLENNIGAGATYKQSHFPKLYCGAYAAGVNAYNVLFTMEELYFIQAEAQYWMGNKTTACALAKEATEHNIERHLERYLADNDGNYPGDKCLPGATATAQKNNKDRYERLLTAFLENEATGKTTPVSERGNKHYFFNPSEFSLSDLMQQKYIAMYLQPEQWTDMRRYHYSNNRNGYGIGNDQEIIYPTLRRPYNLYSAYWVDGLTEQQKESTWIQRINYDPETEEKYNRKELERLGAYKNHEWLRKPMIWAEDYGVRTSLTAE